MTSSVTTSFGVVRFCSICLADVGFEQPDCLDDHGLDCPEWVCVQCGDAVLVGFSLPETERALHPTSHVA
jgi:hypothetical protein